MPNCEKIQENIKMDSHAAVAAQNDEDGEWALNENVGEWTQNDKTGYISNTTHTEELSPSRHTEEFSPIITNAIFSAFAHFPSYL